MNGPSIKLQEDTEMTDVTIIEASSADSAQQWRTALERLIAHPNFARQIVASQFANQERYACLDGESWSIACSFDEAMHAEAFFPFPQLRADVAWIYQATLVEDWATGNGIFARCWKDSPACHACASELRAALEEHIKLMRNIAAEIRDENRKLIA